MAQSIWTSLKLTVIREIQIKTTMNTNMYPPAQLKLKTLILPSAGEAVELTSTTRLVGIHQYQLHLNAFCVSETYSRFIDMNIVCSLKHVRECL